MSQTILKKQHTHINRRCPSLRLSARVHLRSSFNLIYIFLFYSYANCKELLVGEAETFWNSPTIYRISARDCIQSRCFVPAAHCWDFCRTFSKIALCTIMSRAYLRFFLLTCKVISNYFTCKFTCKYMSYERNCIHKRIYSYVCNRKCMGVPSNGTWNLGNSAPSN